MSLTYELRIAFAKELSPAQLNKVKSDVKDFLIGLGEESFVEGVVEGLDLVFEYEKGDHSHYEEHGGQEAPLLLYSYDQAHLRHLRDQLTAAFGARILCTEDSLATEVWQEGWKQGFKPITTQRFYLFPPWDTAALPAGKLSLKIDPGMAFGTGQHETTRLCLEEMERLAATIGGSWQGARVLDAGTGSGILAIAAKKLGASHVLGTDIDPDAIKAAGENAAANDVTLDLWLGSLPGEGTYQYVIANILGVTLLKMVADLTRLTAAGGFLVLSGLLAVEREAIRSGFEQASLRYVSDDVRGDWAVMTFKKLS